MATLNFDGVDDWMEMGTLTAALGALNTGGLTMACLCRRNALSGGAIHRYTFGITNSARTGICHMGHRLSDVHRYTQTGLAGSTATQTNTTDWFIEVVTHAAGTTTPRFHWTNITTLGAGGAWTRENSTGGAIAHDAGMGTTGFVQLGRNRTSGTTRLDWSGLGTLR